MTKSKIRLKAGTLFVLVTLILVAVPAFAEMIVDTAWVRRYTGPVNGVNEAHSIAIDDSGNIYVTGFSDGSGTYYDYATIKYYPNGDTAWVRRYDGPGNDYDQAWAIAADKSGNISVAGLSHGSTGDLDYTTIKYYPNGDTVWVRRYNGPGDSIDVAYKVVVDDSDNVYVAGVSYGSGTSTDYATIKYYPNGDTAWMRRYNGPGNSNDGANAIAVDKSGYVYVSGGSRGIGTDNDYATIKYYPNGDTAWVRRHNGAGNGSDGTRAIAADSLGNIYVTGSTYGGGSNYDYTTIKYYPNGDTAWVRRYNGPGNDYDDAFAIEVDGSGNVYVTGGSPSSYGGFPDYATIKYDPNGGIIWVSRYNGPGNSYDKASALAVDDSGNVYVTGSSVGSGTGQDYATIKYNPNGDTVWVRRYTGPPMDRDLSYAIVTDGSGNVYVTGESEIDSPFEAYATIKYFQALRGDVNRDGTIDVGDVVFLINYLFRYGPSPDPLQTGNTNCIGGVDVGDVVVLINYLFKGGPAPSC